MLLSSNSPGFDQHQVISDPDCKAQANVNRHICCPNSNDFNICYPVDTLPGDVLNPSCSHKLHNEGSRPEPLALSATARSLLSESQASLATARSRLSEPLALLATAKSLLSESLASLATARSRLSPHQRVPEHLPLHFCGPPSHSVPLWSALPGLPAYTLTSPTLCSQRTSFRHPAFAA